MTFSVEVKGVESRVTTPYLNPRFVGPKLVTEVVKVSDRHFQFARLVNFMTLKTDRGWLTIIIWRRTTLVVNTLLLLLETKGSNRPPKFLRDPLSRLIFEWVTIGDPMLLDPSVNCRDDSETGEGVVVYIFSQLRRILLSFPLSFSLVCSLFPIRVPRMIPLLSVCRGLVFVFPSLVWTTIQRPSEASSALLHILSLLTSHSVSSP